MFLSMWGEAVCKQTVVCVCVCVGICGKRRGVLKGEMCVCVQRERWWVEAKIEAVERERDIVDEISKIQLV